MARYSGCVAAVVVSRKMPRIVVGSSDCRGAGTAEERCRGRGRSGGRGESDAPVSFPALMWSAGRPSGPANWAGELGRSARPEQPRPSRQLGQGRQHRFGRADLQARGFFKQEGRDDPVLDHRRVPLVASTQAGA